MMYLGIHNMNNNMSYNEDIDVDIVEPPEHCSKTITSIGCCKANREQRENVS